MQDEMSREAKYTVSIPGYEQPTFCFSCGATHILSMDRGATRTWRCADCGYSGDRFYVACPNGNCGNSFCHLYSPVRVNFGERDEHVAYAEGLAWCDACAHHFVYQWFSQKFGTPQMALVGWVSNVGHNAATITGSATEMIATSS